MILGVKTVNAITLSSSIYEWTGRWGSTIDRVRFWRHALQVAIGSRLIAEHLHYHTPEEAFICGLLHDIGILFMEHSNPDLFEQLWSYVEDLENLSELGLSNWRKLHTHGGRAFLEKWNFPGVICHSVGEHHNDSFCCCTDPETVPIRIVALANLIAPFGIPRKQKVWPEDRKRREALRVSLHLRPEILKKIVKSLMAETLREAAFLEIDIGSEEDYLREANQIIYEQYHAAVESLYRTEQPVEGILDPDARTKILSRAQEVIEEQYKDLKDSLRKDE
jgi:HD-like signal output (HDOD) protein